MFATRVFAGIRSGLFFGLLVSLLSFFGGDQPRTSQHYERVKTEQVLVTGSTTRHHLYSGGIGQAPLINWFHASDCSARHTQLVEVSFRGHRLRARAYGIHLHLPSLKVPASSEDDEAISFVS